MYSSTKSLIDTLSSSLISLLILSIFSNNLFVRESENETVRLKLSKFVSSGL